MNDDSLYTQNQLAVLLVCTRRHVAGMAKEASWPYTTRPGRGGQQRVYRLGDLPTAVRSRIQTAETLAALRLEQAETERAQAAIAEAQLQQADAERQARALGQLEQEAVRAQIAERDLLAEGRKRFLALPEQSRLRQQAEARAWVVSQCRAFQAAQYKPRGEAQLLFAARIIADFNHLPDWVQPWIPRYGGKLTLSEGTLQRWGDAYDKEGKWGLVRTHTPAAARCRVVRQPELYQLVVSAMLRQPQIRAPRMHDFLQAAHPSLARLVSLRSLQRFMAAWKADNPQVWTYVTHPDRWKNIYMAAAGSADQPVHRLNQLWELDSTPGDWLLTDGRHAVIGAVDLYSRRLKFRVSKTSTAAAVKQLLRQCFIDWGVPEAIRTDNGKDYVSESLDSLLQDLRIGHQICIPFASEEKPFIERAMRTMSHGLLELLPGFIGHSVADRKAIEARKSFAERVMQRGEVVEVSLSAAELQTKLNDWADQVYAKDPHGGLDGATPWAVANAWRGPIHRFQDERALDELLADVAGERVIGKKGIRYDHRWYIDPTGILYEHVGETVTLRLDDQDIGRLAVYLKGWFLCWAVDPDAAGIDLREAAAAIKSHQKRWVAAQAKELRALGRELKVDIVQTVIDYRKSQCENLIELPKRAEAYSTPALEAAAEAAKAKSGGPADGTPDVVPFPSRGPRATTPVLPDDLADRLRDIAADMDAPEDPLNKKDEADKYAVWKGLQARLDAGQPLTPREQQFHQSYGETCFCKWMWAEEKAFFGG